MALPTIMLILVFVVSALIMVYRINTPNIFNAQIHTFTFLLETFFLSFVAIGVVAKLSSRNFSQIMAYLGIFIPVIM